MPSGVHPLAPGDEVAFLPPVSGGQQSAVAEDIFQLVRDPIDARALIESLKSPEDGALVVFDGFVRNNFKGQLTLYLEYEAYEPMALAKMREIGAYIRANFPIHRCAIVHRLGRLEIGETSVLDRRQLRAPRRRLRRLPLRHRRPQARRPHLEEGIFRRGRRLDRRRDTFSASHFRSRFIYP